MVRYKCARYYQECEELIDTLENAMRRAFHDWDDLQAYPLKIIDNDNVYKLQDMMDYWDKQGWLNIQNG